ncbi:hypothetical protein J6524_21470 [Bradyrhizobium sp. WSM 1738]|uniref:hypothetical protein n=1 Tax=Bradyrhizobium hereditatis TaxID=2821405 RepID=UPI001CE3124F|nr:hypothetical protein [Bradyrhizobium hereditatis]MCA6117416.1 hypothetical protein [Bradyrhizobium hereditatis]
MRSKGRSTACCKGGGKEAAAEKEAREAIAPNVAAHRLENLIGDRPIALAAQQKGGPRAS